MALVLIGCSGEGQEDSSLPDLPETDATRFESHLTSLEESAVVNVWASWCLPCRSEAPLLDQAHATYGDEIEFIGVNVQDSQPAAKDFLAEFGLGFDHFFDPERSVPNHYEGFGVPITMFFAPGGELLTIHNGVIDEATLALNIDELTRIDG